MRDIKEQTKRAQEFSAKLTRRQRDVWNYAAMGYNNERIGQELGLKLKTIKNNLGAIFRKLKPQPGEDRRATIVMLWYLYHRCRGS